MEDIRSNVGSFCRLVRLVQAGDNGGMVVRPPSLFRVLVLAAITGVAFPLASAFSDETTSPAPPPPVETAPSLTPELSVAPPGKEAPEPTATPTPEATAAASDEPKPEETPPPAAAEETKTASDSTTGSDDSRDSRAESVAEARKERGVPYYQLSRPNWGVELAGSASALGGQDVVAQQGGVATRAFTIQFEYQPEFIQSIGVIGFGPSVSLYPILPAGAVSPKAFSNFAVGGQIRYQARFFREQILVPMAGFEAQMLRYDFNSIGPGTATLTGPFFGAMLLLNVFEPSSAAEMYIDTGISRSYLVAELKNLSGAGGGVTVSGSSLYFGLRFEF